MKNSLKDLVKGVLPAITVQKQGNMETNFCPFPNNTSVLIKMTYCNKMIFKLEIKC
jgi:hypothetical protein